MGDVAEPAPSVAGVNAAPRQLTPADVLTRDDTGRTTARAIRITSPLRVDGRLDDPVYEEVPPMTGFIQTEPNDGEPATEKTEVWVLFDVDNMYVVARCWESQPDRMVLDEMRRDHSGIAQNENLAFSFDTFADGRNGFVFETNALGGRLDMQITNEAPNRDWNAIYESKTGWFDGGWVVEMKIPFKSLRYNPGPNQVWGFNVRRLNKWKNENSYLSPVPRQYGMGGILRVSTAGTLLGIDAPSNRNLEVKPFAISSLTTDATAAPRSADNLASDFGLDVKYGITQNVTADITYRTDFAQVEADEQQLNLTRFNLSFPEKREFFLEGRDLFSFGTRSGRRGNNRGGDTPVLFYSRRIGLNAGRPVSVNAGGRLTGKIGRTSFGVIDIQTDEEPLSAAPATNFAVLRVRRDVLRKSSIGAMFTGRSARAVGTGSNEAFGIDGSFGFFDSLNFATYLARTRTDGLVGDDASYRGEMDYNGDRYGVKLEHAGIGTNFNPEVGFLRRKGVKLTSGELRFSPRPRNSRIVRKYSWIGDGSYIQGPDGRVDARTLKGEFEVQFSNSDRLKVTSNREYEFVPYPFAISSNTTIPVGGYTATFVTMGYNFGRHRRLSGNILVEDGTFFGGHRTALSLRSGRASLGAHVSIEPTYSLNAVDLPQGSSINHLSGSRVTYTMTPLMFTSALVQFNSATHAVSANVRFRWEYRPGSEMFVVFNEERDTLSRTFPALANRALIVKLNFLARQ